MVMLLTPVTIRQARQKDRQTISSLIQFAPYVHRHLDWRAPLDWLTHPPFLVHEEEGNIFAALACPPDPEDIAWVRIFSSAIGMRPERNWKPLWETVKNQLRENNPNVHIASISLSDWYRKILQESGFVYRMKVVVLSWDPLASSRPTAKFEGRIREMNSEDLPEITSIDNLAFGPLWKNSPETVLLSYKQSKIKTVIEDAEGIVGYQISTHSPLGGHLARLAVHPRAQGQGLGYAIVDDLLTRFREQGALRLTVNTQDRNLASLALYKKANFKLTGEQYPVFEYIDRD